MNKSAEDLTGFEMLEIKKVLKTSLEKADGVEATYALAYIFKKREVEGYTYNDALGMTLREVQEYLGVNDEDDEPVEDPFNAEDPKE